jgi:hypothetical protein
MTRNHTTHFDDCGCRSARYERRIAELEGYLRNPKRCDCCASFDPRSAQCRNSHVEGMLSEYAHLYPVPDFCCKDWQAR